MKIVGHSSMANINLCGKLSHPLGCMCCVARNLKPAYAERLARSEMADGFKFGMTEIDLLEAELAMDRMQRRPVESVEVWAERLGSDLGKFTD